jgi:hypothetical protein
MSATAKKKSNLSLGEVFQTWWPLAASWMLMGLELPALSAIVARLADPKINLAAYGGVVFPIALIVESPIIMLLAASTALSKDYVSYRKLWGFMMWTSAILTGIHILVAFTPLYYPIVVGVMGAEPEIVEPARIGLMIMLPWTWAIAYRRFNQGMLIRFGHARAVSAGTFIRLAGNLTILMIGYRIGTLPGIVVATSAVAVGVTLEAVFVGFRIKPVVRDELRFAPPVDPPLKWRAFYDFYIPLALTSLLTLIVQPVGSAAMWRMPQNLDSQAVWPIVSGFIFLLRGMGIAFNEVVVSLMERRGAYKSLRRFTIILAMSSTLIILLVNFTPLAEFWFLKISALAPELVTLAKTGLWLALLMPALNTLQSWYQGAILHSKKTRGITESVVIFIIIIGIVLVTGVVRNQINGLYVGIAAFSLGMLIQTGWLWVRSRPALRDIRQRDAGR